MNELNACEAYVLDELMRTKQANEALKAWNERIGEDA